MRFDKHLGLTIIFTVLAIWFSKNLFISHCIEVSATVNTNKNIELQLFYTENSEENFNEKQSVKKNISSGTTNLKIVLPAQHISKFRFDFGSNPGKVILKKLIFHGKKDIILNFEKLKFHEINTHKIYKEEIEIVSNQRDPFIIFNETLNINQGHKVDWCIFLILLCAYLFVFSKGIDYLAKFKNFEKYSRIDIVFLASFFALLFIPMLNISDAVESEQENRVLAIKPHLFQDGKLDRNFGTKFDSWFNDRFLGRDLITFAYQYLKYAVAPLAGNDKILVGKDGWYFYKPDRSLENFANKVILSETDLENGLNYLKNIDSWCKEHNKNFYYIIIPDKHRIYGEQYRLVNKLRSDKFGIAEQFIDYIQQHSDIKVLYLKDEMLKRKEKGLVYFKQDSHWSDLGAYYGYNAIIGELKKDYNLNAIKVTEWYDATGTISDLIFMLAPQKIASTDKIYKRPVYQTKTECKYLTKYGHKDLGEVFCNNKKNQYNIFVLRDSFFNWLTPYFSDTFNKTKLVWKYNIEREDVEDIDSNYDIVILENVERFIPKILQQKFPNSIEEK